MANGKGSKGTAAAQSTAAETKVGASAKGAGDVQVEETFQQKYTRVVAYFEAHAPPPADAVPGDPTVAMANIRRGWVEIAPHLAELRGDPTVKWELVPMAVDAAEAYLVAVDQIVTEKVTREHLDAARATTA